MAQEKVAQKAELIAADPLYTKGFTAFRTNKGFFVSKNGKLSGAKGSPNGFPADSKNFVSFWKKLHGTQRKFLLYLSGLDERYISQTSYNSIKKAHQEWKEGYYCVQYGINVKWACNIFVGECLNLADLDQLNGGKYYSAQQIWDEAGKFKEVDKKNVVRGDIAAFGGHHVEIMTKVNKSNYTRDDFCSRGAGRGDSSDCQEKCDSYYFNGNRTINNSNIKFLRVK